LDMICQTFYATVRDDSHTQVMGGTDASVRLREL